VREPEQEPAQDLEREQDLVREPEREAELEPAQDLGRVQEREQERDMGQGPELGLELGPDLAPEPGPAQVRSPAGLLATAPLVAVPLNLRTKKSTPFCEP